MPVDEPSDKPGQNPMNTPPLAFFAAALMGLVLSGSPLRAESNPAEEASPSPKLGIQTWTCRNMTFDQVVDFASSHHIKYLEFIAPQHLDPDAPPAENLRKKAVLEQHGLVAYSFGVVRPGLDKAANRKLFEFARLMGMKLIVVEPLPPAAWDNLEELVKEYDIKLAIHNHNLGTPYGDPATIEKVLAARDRRIGVCLDIGWVTAAGFDAAAVFRNYGDRVYDMHFKDKVVEMRDGKSVSVDTEIGRGNANYEGLFAAIRQSGWSGVMAIETDSLAFARDPNRLVSDAQAFFNAHVTGETGRSEGKPDVPAGAAQ
jgi:L-ribulose-5-phosphate 3-epimerase